ncbi:S-methyl-5'-thioadenosine deaminase [Candidatus Magnetaquicoccaceae bacterium FCR-1]|uniref:5-methylthioadenosine/S-adenosylhomocysteine deaminase n=1 Tax=Candidatus Magnetaquiglobus chichijimensis TaxID=3141448 RepID=A0ABQ0C8Q6_9PROT
MNLFIRDARLPDHPDPVHIAIQDGRILAIGPEITPATPEIPILDAGGLAATPGLVNGHTHASMTLFRGFGDDMPLMQWLQTRIWPAEARLDEEDVYWGARLACLEMIRSGTVAFEDMYWHFHGMARAVEDSGLKAGVGAVMIDVAGPEQGEACRRLAETTFEESGRYSDRVRFTLTPHAIYTVSPESLRWTADFSARHDLPVHIHLSETGHEVETCLKHHGVRPAFHLDRQGLLTPRVILAHGVWLDDDELDLIARRGATLVTNPVSNMKLAVGGVFPFARAQARGIPIALGTDGAASNNTLDLFQEMKFLALIQKHAQHDPTALPAHQVWEVATGAKAPLVGQTGQLTVGAPADLLLLRHHEPEMTPEHDLISNLVYSATGHVVDTMIVAGRILMRNRVVPDEAEIRREARERARRVCTP